MTSDFVALKDDARAVRLRAAVGIGKLMGLRWAATHTILPLSHTRTVHTHSHTYTPHSLALSTRARSLPLRSKRVDGVATEIVGGLEDAAKGGEGTDDALEVAEAHVQAIQGGGEGEDEREREKEREKGERGRVSGRV